MLEILLYPDPILREKAKEVTSVDDEIRTLLSEMAETMYDAPGIGLAAPQVGISKRIAIVDIGEETETGRDHKLYNLINPRIISSSGSMKYEEGCLSIPGIREFVERPSQITVEAVNELGEEYSLEAEGLLAICIQHEIDHLDGILFTDHLNGLKKKLAAKKLQKLFGSSKG